MEDGQAEKRAVSPADMENPPADAPSTMASQSSSSSRRAEDPSREVRLAFEVLSDKTMKRLFRVLYVSIQAAIVALLALLSVKLTGHMQGIDSVRPLLYVNTVVATVGLAAVWTGFGMFVGRLWQMRRLGLCWSLRRRRLLATVLFETASVGLIDVLYLTPNVYALARRCGYFDSLPIWAGYLRTVLWGTILSLYTLKARFANLWVDKRGRSLGPREDATLLDAPLCMHWPVAAHWAAFQALMLAGQVSHVVHMADVRRQSATLCEENITSCASQEWIKELAYALVALLWGMFGMYVYYVRRAFKRLHKRSYDEYRWEFIRLRYDIATGGVGSFVGIACYSLLFFVERTSCLSYNITVFGYVPLQLCFNAITAVNVVWYMPTCQQAESGGSAAIGDRLHWTEATLPWGQVFDGVKEAPESAQCTVQPSFCFETAVKAYYWCELVYEHSSRSALSNPSFDLSVALGLYSLQHCELVREKLDTNAFVAWNERTIVVSFRGTYSATNLLTDLMMWRVPHQEPRGHFWLGTMALVHSGFSQSWKTLSRSVMPKICKIVGSCEFQRTEMRVLLTGHSLGGAIAQLAAYDIRKLLKLEKEQVTVYTFGCPRVGNQAFALDYSKAVPDTWQVVNSIDAIAKSPSPLFLYKHSAHKVVINAQGHMIISPTFLEMKLTTALCKRSMPDHLLSNYRKSFCAIVRAQFIKKKGLPGGKHGLAELVRRGIVTKALGVEGRAVAQLESWGSRVWEKQKKVRNEKALKRIQATTTWLLAPLAVCISNKPASDRHYDDELISAARQSPAVKGMSSSAASGCSDVEVPGSELEQG